VVGQKLNTEVLLKERESKRAGVSYCALTGETGNLQIIHYALRDLLGGAEKGVSYESFILSCAVYGFLRSRTGG
jgi:hypothetical protein